MQDLKELDIDELVARAQYNIDDGCSFAEICRRFTGLVMKYARQNHLAGIFDEAVSVGWVAVVEAVKSYEPSKGVKFAGYVDSRVKYAIWNFFKKQRRKWQMEIPGVTSFEGEEINIFDILADTTDTVLQVTDKIELNRQIWLVNQVLPEISDKQQRVIKLTVINGLKLKEAAGQMGITPQAVHNLQRRGLSNLRKKLVGVL